MEGPHERALVVMGKLPRPGRVKTRLGLAPEVAAELYRAFLLDVFDVAAAALAYRPGRRVFACALEPGAGLGNDPLEEARALAPAGWSVVPQVGEDLGARMRHAWRAGQAKKTLVIGSDLPSLPARRIVDAFDALGPGRVVFVPALDGGYVLVGLTEDTPLLFEGIAWSTPTVLEASRRAAARAGLEVVTLPPQGDVDAPEDLERLRGELSSRSRTAVLLASLGREGRLSGSGGPE